MICPSYKPGTMVECESSTVEHKYCVGFDPEQRTMVHWPNPNYVPLKVEKSTPRLQARQNLHQLADQIKSVPND